MNYNQAVAFIEAPGATLSRLGLSRMSQLLGLLGDPHKKLKYVHIAGTNGKGSCAAMTASVLKEAGFRTGLYTSPHLRRYNERIKVNGEDISDEDFCAAAEELSACLEDMEDMPTTFERLTAMAILHFAKKACDIVVLEVGLGGRLDATNVIEHPECCAITNIDLDHTEILGDTIELIAAEKGGIIKPGCPVVMSAQSKEAQNIVAEICEERGARLIFSDPLQEKLKGRGLWGQRFDYRARRDIEISLPGTYQLSNAAVVLDIIDALKRGAWEIPEEAVWRGMKRAHFPGRFEVFSEDPLVIADGAHNPNGAAELARCIREYIPERNIYFVMGVMADKDYKSMLRILMPLAEGAITVTPDSPRSLPAENLAMIIEEEFGVEAQAIPDMKDALDAALCRIGQDEAICICGSLYQLGSVQEYFEAR